MSVFLFTFYLSMLFYKTVFYGRQGANDQTYRLMASDYRCPWRPAIPQASQVHCRPFRVGVGVGGGVGVWSYGILTHLMKQSESCFTADFCEAVASLWLSHVKTLEKAYVQEWTFFICIICTVRIYMNK